MRVVVVSGSGACARRPARRAAMLLVLLVLAACSPRPSAKWAEPHPAAQVERVFVATEMSLDDLGGMFGKPRPSGLKYFHVDVSVPPTHKPGQIEWPEGPPDAATDFVLTGSDIYPRSEALIRAMDRAQPGRETLVFVHGYNNTFSDAAYRFAQMRADFGYSGPGLLYLWPSAGDARGYVYDRDSVLYSRDALRDVLAALTRAPDRRVLLLGHSMGAQLVMETLRQIALSGDRQLLHRVSGVVLLSPDIDPDLFRRQAEAIGTLPDPFLIFISRQDRALSLAGLLTGRRPRLGTILPDPMQLGGVEGVKVIDVTDLGSGEGLNHSVPISSPAAISALKGVISQDRREASSLRDYLLVLAGDG